MRFFPVMLALGACGGGGSSDSLDVKIANAAVVAVRSGDTWKPVMLDGTGAGKVDIDGPTMLATVCDSGGFFNYYTLFLGPGIDDSVPLDFSCGSISSLDIEVTIAGSPSTRVFIGIQRNFQGSTVNVAPGTYDVIAVDPTLTPARFEIRRAVAITANTTLTFDLATSGTPMTATRIAATGANPDESPTFRTSLVTAARTFVSLDAPAGNGWLFPESALASGDRQTVSSSTTSETLGSRTATREVAGGEATATLALPAYLTSVTPLPTSVAWQGGDWNSFYYGINAPDFSVLWDLSVFAEWSEAGGDIDTITMPDPTGIPGWQSTWNLGATTGYQYFFSASLDQEPDSFSASRFGEL